MRFVLCLLTVLITVSAVSPAHADHVVLLLSDDKPAFTDVASAFEQIYKGKTERVNLHGNNDTINELTRPIEDADDRFVIAIGSLAAKAARQRLPNKLVIFCQVFNHEQFDLITPWMKGVSALPPLNKQFHAWTLLNPQLKTIGSITGKNASTLVDEAKAAARANHLRIINTEVNSDREVMYALRAMKDHIDGFWLAPDSSILSSKLLLEILAYGVREGLQILVFTPDLLKVGGLLSAIADNQDIAKQILSRLNQVGDAKVIPGEAVTPLATAKITVNQNLVERFKLNASALQKEYNYESR